MEVVGIVFFVARQATKGAVLCFLAEQKQLIRENVYVARSYFGTER